MTLKGRRFSSSSEVIENATVELNKLRKIDFELAFQQPFSTLEKKCVDNRGSYFIGSILELTIPIQPYALVLIREELNLLELGGLEQMLWVYVNFLQVCGHENMWAVRQNGGMARKDFIKQLALQLMRDALNMRNQAKNLSRDLQVLIQKHAGTSSLEERKMEMEEFLLVYMVDEVDLGYNRRGLTLVVKAARNKYLRAINRAKKTSWKIFIEENESTNAFGNAYRIFKRLGSADIQVGIPLLNKTAECMREQKMKEMLTAFFPDDDVRLDNEEHTLIRNHIPSFTNREIIFITEKEIKDLCSNLNIRKAPGPDNVSNYMIKHSLLSILPSLVKLFNECLVLGYYPESWKHSVLKIITKPQKADYEAINSYRPISLTSNFSKIFETIIKNKILNYYNHNNLLSHRQHGFTKRKSTITALDKITETILKHKQNELVALIAIDISGAFDNAWWPALIKRMDEDHVPAVLIKIIQSFLNRRRKTSLTFSNTTISKYLSKGCPQGGPLSPLLWNIVLNDLLINFASPNSEIICYADDVSIVCWHKTIEGLKNETERTLNYVIQWCTRNKLKLSPEKTGLIHMHGKQNIPMGTPNFIIKPVEEVKNFSLYQIEKLNKQNFETWRLQMQMILVHSDLWIYVNEANVKPEPGNQEFTNWQNKDQKALATIVLSLNPSELIHVKNCKTAEEAWKKIKEVYRPKGPATRVSLTKRLIQMKMRPNDDLKDYLSKFTSLVDNLGEIGAQVPEDFLVILLLCSLPESYEGFRTAIETRDELPKLETLKVKIIEKDQRQREMEGTSSGEQNVFFGNPERKTTNSTKPPNRKDFKFNCHYCGKKGHKAADCWSKRNSKRNNTRMAASLGIRDENILEVDEWCLDSGATAHMCCLRTAFSDLRETEPIPVKLANDQSIEALGTGTVELEVLEHGEPFLLKLENVLFVPGLKGNLFSVSTCTEKSFFVKFMREKEEIVNPLRKICIEAYKRNGLYILRQTKYAKTQFTRMCIDKNSSEIWHNRFGHLNFDDLKKLQRENLVNGLPKGEFKSITSCETCIRGKQTRLPFPEVSLTKSTEPLQLIHSDICGPMRTKSYGGALYFATFIDDFSRMIFTFVMKRKSEIFKGFKVFKRFAEKQTGKKIKAIRSDNAAEYLSSDFKEYLLEEGIIHQLSVEYSPQQNGVAERANRTLVEMTRCFIIQANLPDPLWAELVHTSTYIRNRCPRTNESRTPYEIFTGRKPTVSHLRIIGCKCFAVDNRPRRGKFAPRSEEYRLIGYSPESKANDVVQIEAIPQKGEDTSLEEESLQDDENTLPGTDSDFLGEPSETMEVISQRGRGRPRYIRTGKPGRPRKEYPTANLSTQEFSEVKYSPDPKDAEEALSGKDSYFWRKAMKEEFDSLIENKTWELVDPPKGQNVIGSKWAFRRKYSSDGSLERYKARLVAKGYSQKYGIDYEETFTPVVRHSTIRTVLALAVEYDLLVHQMDVQSAFLNGDVKEEIYITQPENFESKKYPRRVCKLKKAIYGLKQAGMTWHAKLDSVLKEMGLEQMKTDNCVYIKREEGVLLVAIYVDDLIIAAERKDTLISFKESMKKIFKIKDLGKINYCLGIRIQTEKDGSISIDQEKYIEELLAKYRMKEAKPISTPMDSNSKLTKISSIEGENEPVKKEEYQSLIGSLIYLSVSTRPDIAYAVSALGQFSNDPRRQHWNAAKRVLRYLKGTLCLKITYEKTNETLYGCVDADWGGNLADRKSQTGLVFFLAGGPIAWESKKQQTVALSSTESEYIALCEAGKEAVYLRALLDEMGFGELLNEPTVLKTDNQGAQQLARNPVHHARTKHIDIKWHYIRSICSDGLIEVVHIPTQENVADILTKGLPRVLYDKHVAGLGM
ncbi:hypothetical protein LAZ67_9001917 [Cordylochernes scorpioides]|uniref:Retrovirus-related Pol polyprotein from transposon TNT 1-94 n=1 Tax=Cordylochernes scorpioides TaxID=51811 RepID=A0ABY6KTE0_9ARAC|nr:hypothetical protein LAZ67_9001917 [Cordylochernes scorpioides]